MQSENGLLIDLGRVNQVLESADVFAIGFANFAERFLVDTRANSEAGPMVRVVEPLGSVQERYLWLGKERPSFDPPEAFVFFSWPHSVVFLAQSGVWQRIRQRVGAATRPDAARQCDNAWQDLIALDRANLLDAILGRQYVSLWPQEQQQPQA